MGYAIFNKYIKKIHKYLIQIKKNTVVKYVSIKNIKKSFQKSIYKKFKNKIKIIYSKQL